MAVSKDEIIEAIKQMPALELSELVKELEEVFGVSAAAPVMMGAMPAAGAEAAVEEEKDSFDVVLEGFGDNKIAVIKVVRELTGLGLKEAKDVVEGTPSTILSAIGKDAAADAKGKLEAEGAQVEIKAVG
jgi:large subunit ribosomal protein L7/L12